MRTSTSMVMEAMVIHPQHSSTSVDANFYLEKNDGSQPAASSSAEDQIALADDSSASSSCSSPFFCFEAADPLLLTTIQEVSKEQYHQYKIMKEGIVKTGYNAGHGGEDEQPFLGCLEPPHVIAPSPTPSFVDADEEQEGEPPRKIQQQWGRGREALIPCCSPVSSTNDQSLSRHVMEQEPVTTALRLLSNDTNPTPTSSAEHQQQHVGQINSMLSPESYQSGVVGAPPHETKWRTRLVLQRMPPETTTTTTTTLRRNPSIRDSSEWGRELPKDFVPGLWSVLVGRDKASLRAPGNHRLRMLVHQHLERYAKCSHDKMAKTRIISEIESTIRRRNCSSKKVWSQKEEEGGGGEQQQCEGGGAFIKFQDEKWWEVAPVVAREKIGRLFREFLHTKYSSASRRKRLAIAKLKRAAG